MTLVFSMCAAALAQLSPEALKPYPLTPGVQRSLDELAAQSDVLILGETHGTQEVPAVAAALLAPLAKLGYQALALEVPSDQRAALAAWATGKTTTVPSFFAKPWEDGRGNTEALNLIRTALSPPFRWKLICFDVTEDYMRRGIAKMNRDVGQGAENKSAATLDSEQVIALSMQRDAVMASNLADQIRQLAPRAKMLAICGTLHARTANRSTSDKMFMALWPSFAAKLQSNHPAWRVRSINVMLHSGGFFAMTVPPDGGPPRGGVQRIHATRHLDEMEAHPTPDGDWNLELDLPHATPATFLATPSNPVSLVSTEPDSEPRASLAVEQPSPCLPRNRLPRNRFRCHRRTCRH